MVFAHRHHDLLLFRCDAAMLHSLNSGRATSDWTASGRSLVKSKQASMAAIDWVFVLCFFFWECLFLSCPCRIKRRFPLTRMCALPPHIQPATDEQEQTKEIRARPRARPRPAQAQDMHPLQGAASEASRDRLCRPVAVLHTTTAPTVRRQHHICRVQPACRNVALVSSRAGAGAGAQLV